MVAWFLRFLRFSVLNPIVLSYFNFIAYFLQRFQCLSSSFISIFVFLLNLGRSSLSTSY